MAPSGVLRGKMLAALQVGAAPLGHDHASGLLHLPVVARWPEGEVWSRPECLPQIANAMEAGYLTAAITGRYGELGRPTAAAKPTRAASTRRWLLLAYVSHSRQSLGTDCNSARWHGRSGLARRKLRPRCGAVGLANYFSVAAARVP
jgi:hypothetical protein